VIPFWLVISGQGFFRPVNSLVVMGIAAYRSVHMIYFLHMNTRSGRWLSCWRWLTFVVLATAGRIDSVMYHLNANMMPTMVKTA
jgi:heme/copper-type cytochrome/quinol oxidase subunit 4